MRAGIGEPPPKPGCGGVPGEEYAQENCGSEGGQWTLSSTKTMRIMVSIYYEYNSDILAYVKGT